MLVEIGRERERERQEPFFPSAFSLFTPVPLLFLPEALIDPEREKGGNYYYSPYSNPRTMRLPSLPIHKSRVLDTIRL